MYMNTDLHILVHDEEMEEILRIGGMFYTIIYLLRSFFF